MPKQRQLGSSEVRIPHHHDDAPGDEADGLRTGYEEGKHGNHVEKAQLPYIQLFSQTRRQPDIHKASIANYTHVILLGDGLARGGDAPESTVTRIYRVAESPTITMEPTCRGRDNYQGPLHSGPAVTLDADAVWRAAWICFVVKRNSTVSLDKSSAMELRP